MLREQKGITLVALVITIIVLLILAGVSISLVVGEEGVLTRASGAVISNEAGAAKENIELAFATLEIDYQTEWANNTTTKRGTFYTLDNANELLSGGFSMEMVGETPEGATNSIGEEITPLSGYDVLSGNADLTGKEILVAYKAPGADEPTYYFTVDIGLKGGSTATFQGYDDN